MSRPRARGAHAAKPSPVPLPVWLVAAALAAGLLAFDPGAEESFEAPKRVLVHTGSVLALALLAAPWVRGGATAHAPVTRGARGRNGFALLVLAALALIAAALSAASAADSGSALAALRTAALFGLLVPLGAALPLAGRGATLLLGAALGGCALNAALALAQVAGIVTPFAVESLPGRTAALGLLGNEGLLACVLAVGAVGAAGVALHRRAPGVRAAAGACALLCGAGILATRNLTALAALLCGLAVLLALRLGRRAALPLGAAAALLATAALLMPGTRGRLAETFAEATRGRWDQVLSQRFGAWAAAAETIRADPALGAGPGSFAAAYVPRRLEAELRLRRRLAPPPPATTFGEAHNDPLDAAAAIGVPGALALLAAAALLLVALVRTARDPQDPARAEASILAAILGTGAVTSLTWFPMQRTPAALLLLLAAGRAWSISGGAGGRPAAAERRLPPPARIALAALGCAAALGALVPEWRGLAAERRLRRAVGELRAAGAGPSSRLEAVIAEARALAPALPHDPRPLQLAGAAHLLSRRPEEALARYRLANALGERAENDLNIGRAYAMLDRRPEAFAAFVRAAWIAPHLVGEMPAAAQELVRGEVARLEALLADGRLPAPPPLP